MGSRDLSQTGEIIEVWKSLQRIVRVVRSLMKISGPIGTRWWAVENASGDNAPDPR